MRSSPRKGVETKGQRGMWLTASTGLANIVKCVQLGLATCSKPHATSAPRPVSLRGQIPVKNLASFCGKVWSIFGARPGRFCGQGSVNFWTKISPECDCFADQVFAQGGFPFRNFSEQHSCHGLGQFPTPFYPAPGVAWARLLAQMF